MGTLRPTLALLAASLVMAPPLARADEAACAKFKWPIAREQKAFAGSELSAISDGKSLPGIGQAANLSLQPQASVSFARAPGRKPRVDPAFAAVVSLPAVGTAGRYQVTLSEDAWIDVLQNGKEVRSAGFSAQRDCPGVRKSVRFALEPGPATLQISGASVDAMKIDVLPVE